MDNRVNRRHMLRLMGGGVAAGIVSVAGLRAQPAQAGIRWCRLDPVIELNRKVFHIYVYTFQDDISPIVTGPTKVDVTVPVGSKARVLDVDDGFGQGYDVRFIYEQFNAAGPTSDVGVTSMSAQKMRKGSATPFIASAYVPAIIGQPIVIDVETDAGVLLDTDRGATNMWLTVSGAV